MSLSSSLANAMTGLNASARSAQVVSSNIANAMTEGYGRRELELSSQTLGRNGAGVTVVGTTRHADPVLIADRRSAQSEQGSASTMSGFLGQLESAIGIPGDAGSLSATISQFENALIEASSRPDSTVRLQNVLTASQDLAGKFNAISDDIQNLRVQADNQIFEQVSFLNKSLKHIEYLNQQIQNHSNTNRDVNALVDQRQVAIDAISSIVPLKLAERDNGTVALFTEMGAILVDGRAGTFEFSSTPTIVPEMTISSGALSGLSLNGTPINTNAERNAIKGGSLSALFQARDNTLVSAQSEIDSIARNIIERFSDPALDPTSTGGLFTDGGASFDPLNEIAISQRISVSSAVIPEAGGAIWRIRDGIGAVSQGDVGNADTINRMLGALRNSTLIASGSMSSGSTSFANLATNFVSQIGSAKHASETDLTYAITKTETLRTQELSGGVDTDQEMQKLLLVERSYAANAKIIQSIDELFDLLLGI
ncbi:flagellar hook-associated protein FlgK [Halocynthiibacter sp. C4]|uniref:flagellar hook-associated protein FlgK n=1 Tax=Halocynthiibacter sp. C4 TaxID=2992758 RepID=UPI00237BCE80|nr:flagellar hook-associated protein FlgK [Halocynthiibacter sp. C4]MDE0588352.1 flagellar hook-associated protein FlgK [Halocynthiibacter sp. C4]